MSFRLQARHIALTYPKADFSLEDGLTFLRNRPSGSANVVAVAICSETHADGSLHRHAYVRYDRRVHITNNRFFDFATFHPNVQACRNVAAWNNYIREDGEFLEWESDNQNATGLYENAATMDEVTFFEWASRARIPYGYAQRAWDMARSPMRHITFGTDETTSPFLDTSGPLGRDFAGYSLSQELTNVLVGYSGCGKTLFCFRHLIRPFLLISHMDDLKYFDSTVHKAILYDDMKFDHLPLQAQIHICDRGVPRSIHRRYGTTLIPAGIQVAITCNEIPFTYHPAIARRCNRLLIGAIVF